MSVQLSQGTTVAIAATYGATKSMTVVTNATEAVGTLEASHGIIVGDVVELTSGWGALTGRIARAKTVTTNDVTWEKIDTSNVTRYPVGQGAGSVREILTFTQMTQLSEFNFTPSSVADVDTTFLEDLVASVVPGLESAAKASGTFFFDLSLAWISTLRTASENRVLTAFLQTTPSGNKLYANGYWQLSEIPLLQVGQAIKTSFSTSLKGRPTGYVS